MARRLIVALSRACGAWTPFGVARYGLIIFCARDSGLKRVTFFELISATQQKTQWRNTCETFRTIVGAKGWWFGFGCVYGTAHLVFFFFFVLFAVGAFMFSSFIPRVFQSKVFYATSSLEVSLSFDPLTQPPTSFQSSHAILQDSHSLTSLAHSGPARRRCCWRGCHMGL